MIFEVAATICAGIFAGAAVYINVVEHPVWMAQGVQSAAHGFPARYHRGAAMQAPLAMTGMIAGIIAWATGSDVGWLAGAVVLGAVVPFTLVIIGPTTNRHLLDTSSNRPADETRRLLVQWGWLHGVRSVLSAAAFVLFAGLLAAD